MLASFQLIADDAVEYIAEVSTSNKSINFSTVDGDTGNPVSFAPKILTLDYTGTVSYEKYYVRLKLSQAIQDDVVYDGDVILMTRSDYDLTLGFYVGSGVSVYLGNKRGKFELNVIGEEAVAFPVVNRNVKFIDEGGFLGLSYVKQLDRSSLSFSLAYASMDGEIKINEGAASFITTGDTTGYSLSAAWSLPISESTNLSVVLNTIRYDFDDKDLGLALDFSTEQSFDNVSVGLVHYF